MIKAAKKVSDPIFDDEAQSMIKSLVKHKGQILKGLKNIEFQLDVLFWLMDQ